MSFAANCPVRASPAARSMAATVIDALRRFLPDHVREHPHAMTRAQRRAVWAINHCRTAAMGGHLHACGACATREFHFHSCNHRSCPQCGSNSTLEWVDRQLTKRVGAPYFMVTFTLPADLRRLFLSAVAKDAYQLLFASASSALRDTLANPRWLGATTSGFITVLHTWNQRLQFHPHLHCIVPGAGLDVTGRLVTVKSPQFLVPQPALRSVFRARFRDGLAQLATQHTLPDIDPAVWQQDWGVHLQPFGTGERIIQYLGSYVCRTAIGDSRIVRVTDSHVSFRYKDRARGGVQRTETLTGAEFTARYLRHVLPRGLRAIRYNGFCHPAAKAKHERIAMHTGRPLLIGAAALTKAKPAHVVTCPCCRQPMMRVLRVPPAWSRARPPPAGKKSCA